MANSCCQESYTECNKIVTIAYLKSFVGNNIQNTTDGSAMSVNSSDDNYCPTYGELVGGSLVQNHVAAASGRWSDDVDGITVGGGYANNECVRQEDLSLTYTRFKSLTSSVGKTTFDQCSDRTDLTYIYTLTRTKKSMNPNCTIDTVNTDGTDTNNAKITNTSSNNAFTVTKTEVSAGKNGPTTSCPARAPERSTTITTKVNFRGAEHSSTVSITQSKLDGSYVYYQPGSSSYTSNSYGSWESYGPTGCEGGDYGRCRDVYIDTYTTTWDVENWRDDCNVNYYTCTRITNKMGPTRTSHDYVRRQCESQGTLPNTCSSCCTESDTDYYSETYYDTLPCEGGSVYVGTTEETAVTHYNKSEDESCASEICSDSYSYYTVGGGYTQTYPRNDRATTRRRAGYVNGRYFSITQDGCPQNCDCEPTYTYVPLNNYPASGGTATVRWNKTYPGCTNNLCVSGVVSTDVSIGCNSGSSRNVTGTYEYEGANLSWTVGQLSGTPATCGAGCDCYSATTPATVTASSYSATSAQVSFTVNKRVGGTWGSPTARTENVTFSANTGSSAVNRTGVITLNDCNSCDGNCEDKLKVNWTVVVPGKTCTCADIEPTGTTAVTIPQSGGTYEFTYSNCVGYVDWTSSSWAVPSRTSRTFTITAAENNTTSARTVSLTFTFYLQEGDTTPCGTYTVEITQAGKFECPEYEFRNSPVPKLDWQGGTATFVPYDKNA